MKIGITIKFLILSLFLFIFTSCSFSPIMLGEKDVNGLGNDPGGSYTPPVYIPPPYEIIETSILSITILWDAPDGTIPNSYKFHFREFQNYTWHQLSEISSSSPLEFAVTYASLGTTAKDIVFGVSAVYSDGESLIHSSLDSTAEPNTGWYVRWN